MNIDKNESWKTGNSCVKDKEEFAFSHFPILFPILNSFQTTITQDLCKLEAYVNGILNVAQMMELILEW